MTSYYRPVDAEFADAVERARGEFELDRLRTITEAANIPANLRASAWLLERWDPARYGGRRFIEVARAMAANAINALLEAAVDLVERPVPPERRDAELANLIAVAGEIVGGLRDRPIGE